MDQRFNPTALRVGSCQKIGDLPTLPDPSLQGGDRIIVREGVLATLVMDDLGNQLWDFKVVTLSGDFVLAKAGTGALNAGGVLLVADPNVTASSRFLAFANNGGAPLTGVLQQTAKTIGADFTILSSAGAADATCVIFWQRWEPIP